MKWTEFRDLLSGLGPESALMRVVSIPRLLQPAIKAFGRLKDSFTMFTDKVKSAGTWAMEHVLKPLGTWTISQAAPAALDLLAAAFDVLTSVCEALEEPAQWVWDNFLEPIAAWTGDLVIAALEGLTGALTGLSDWIDENQALIQNVVVPLAAFFAAITAGQAVVGIITAITGAFAAIGPAISAFGAAVSTFGVFGVLKGVLYSILGVGAPVIAVIAAIAAAGVLLWKNWDTVCAWAKKLKKVVSEAWNKLKTNVVKTITNLKKAAVSKFTEIKKKVENTVTNLKKNVTDTWDKLKESVTDTVDNIKSGVTETWDNIKGSLTDTMEGIKSGIAEKWEAAKKTVEETVDKITSKINGIQEDVEEAGGIVEYSVGLVQDAWTTVSDWVKDKIGGAVEKAVGLAKDGWTKVSDWIKDNIGGAISKAIGLEKKGWTNIANWVKDNLGGAVSKAIGLGKDGWSTVSGWVKDKVGNAAVNVSIGLKKTWSSIKNWIKDNITDKISSIKIPFKMPTITLKTGSKTFFGKKITYPTGFKIKWNAKGAVLDGAQIFGSAGSTLLGGGEAGREAILPLDKNTDWMDTIADKVKQKIAEVIGSAAAQPAQLDASAYLRQCTPTLAAMERSGEQTAAALRASREAEAQDNTARLETLLEAILALLKDIDPVALDPESLRKYFIRVTNRNTQANGGRCELKV